MIKLDVETVGFVEGTDTVVLLLRASDLGKVLPMQIGLLEARAISFEMEQVKTPRPLTHELLAKTIERLGARVVRAVIREFRNDIYYADLVLGRGEGGEVAVDARPSDAIAIALRAAAPIYAATAVLEEKGVAAQVEEAPDEGPATVH